MSKLDRFFRGMAMICLGVIIGFLISPIKQGIRVTIGSNNRDSELLNEYHVLDDDDFDDFDEDDEDLDEIEDFEDEEPDFETPDDEDEEEIPF